MIYTVTCNPAIDKTINENGISFDIGGKGINVSKVLKVLDTDSVVLGFIGKDNKDLVYKYLDELNLKHDFVEIDGSVRTNTKVIENGKLIEYNEAGPEVSIDQINRLKDKLSKIQDSIVAISGSAPKNVDKYFYYDLVSILKKSNNYVILDCDKDLLKYGINAKPDVIKPNKDEVLRLFDIEYNEETIINKCKELNIDNVIVSLGEQGALFIKEKAIKYPALKIDVKSPVGAGDSMVSALAYCKDNGFDYDTTVKYVMALSFAAVSTSGSKAPKKEIIEYYISKVG